jgi:LysM repeat protein
MLSLPLLALANPFSLKAFFAGFGTRVDAAGAETTNSQRLPLPSPATNLDPNPIKGGSDLPVEGGMALAAAVGPEGTTADIEEHPASTQISVHTVRPGETLSEIAALYKVSVNTILWANDIRGGIIHPGDHLVILPVTGIRHTVVLGESLQSLAKKYGGTAEDIALYNGLDAGAALSAGQTVIIPNGELPSTPVAKKSSDSKKPAGPGTKKPAGKLRSVSSAEPYLGGSGPAIGGFAWPVAGGRITQGLHGWNGVDIGAYRDAHILASAAGTVIVARNNGGWNGGYGNYVVISHPNGTQTLYAHMDKVLVSMGESVSQGQTIGLMGATGKATGVHLHFEVRGAQNPFAN